MYGYQDAPLENDGLGTRQPWLYRVPGADLWLVGFVKWANSKLRCRRSEVRYNFHHEFSLGAPRAQTSTRPFWTKNGNIARADPRWLTQPGAAAERILSIAVNLPPEKEACA